MTEEAAYRLADFSSLIQLSAALHLGYSLIRDLSHAGARRFELHSDHLKRYFHDLDAPAQELLRPLIADLDLEVFRLDRQREPGVRWMVRASLLVAVYAIGLLAYVGYSPDSCLTLCALVLVLGPTVLPLPAFVLFSYVTSVGASLAAAEKSLAALREFNSLVASGHLVGKGRYVGEPKDEGAALAAGARDQVTDGLADLSRLDRPATEVSLMTTTHCALRVVLYLLAGLIALAGLLMILSNRSLIMRVFLHPPESEMSTLLLAGLKELGGLGVMVGLLLFFAARDPVRNVAIIDGFIVGLAVLTVTPLLSLATLDVQRLYPPALIWARSLTRLALAVVLYVLRPRENHARAA